MADTPATQPVPAVSMRDVHVRRGDVNILQDVSWTVPRGSSCAVLGPNGSGKTTLMRTITGYMWPTSGTVEVIGRRLGQTDVRELRKHIGVVDPSERCGVDEDLTALDAVLTGYFATLSLYDEVTAEQREQAEQLVETVGLAHRIKQKVRVLSTGEKRRALLARSPEILILDEPTAGLDVSGRERVLATIAQLRQLHPEVTLFMITHHVEEIGPDTDQCLLLKRGRIAASGPPDAVITPETLSDVLGCKVYVQKRAGRFWLEVLPEAWLDLVEPQ